MTMTEFEDALRERIHREPFRLFAIELHDGRVIEIDERSISFSAGMAGFLTSDYDLIEFTWDDVRAR